MVSWGQLDETPSKGQRNDLACFVVLALMPAVVIGVVPERAVEALAALAVCTSEGNGFHCSCILVAFSLAAGNHCLHPRVFWVRVYGMVERDPPV